MPQGWGFFSRDPREEDLFVFELNKNHWQKSSHAPISNIHNCFGINRFPRAQSVELAMLMSGIQEKSRKSYAVNINAMTLKDTVALAVRNTSPYPTLKGKLCIVKQQPIPWAWAWNERKLQMPAKYLVLQIHQQ